MTVHRNARTLFASVALALIVVACSSSTGTPSQGGAVGGCPTSQPAAATAGTTRDVTERKRFEEELRDSEQRFRTITNAMLANFTPINSTVGELATVQATFTGGTWARDIT